MNNSFNSEKMNNIKNLVDSGDINSAISQISPEMIENFSKLLNQNSNQNSSHNSNQNNESAKSSTFNNNFDSTSNDNNSQNSIPNLGNIDMETIMKISSTLNKVNSKDDPRANLLNSLKPYLRDTKKEKLNQYINLLNVSKIADIMKDTKKGG